MENQPDQQKQPENSASETAQAEEGGFYRSDSPETETTGESFAGNQLSDGLTQAQTDFANDTEQTLSWTASESIDHHKTGGWYVALLLGISVFAVLIWLVTKDLITSIVVLVAGIVLAGFAATQPRQLTYQLGPHGLAIGNRHYSYSEFKSFTLVRDGGISSIMLRPLKRFGSWTTIYFEPKDEQDVVNLLASRLPHEAHQPDAIDKFLRKIRF